MTKPLIKERSHLRAELIALVDQINIADRYHAEFGATDDAMTFSVTGKVGMPIFTDCGNLKAPVADIFAGLPKIGPGKLRLTPQLATLVASYDITEMDR